MLSGWCCYSEAQWLCRYPKHELASGRAFRSSARMCLSVTNLAATKGAWRRFFNCRRRLWFYLLWRSRCMPRPMRSLMSSAVCKCLRHEILFCFSQSLYIDSVRTWLVSFALITEKSVIKWRVTWFSLLQNSERCTEQFPRRLVFPSYCSMEAVFELCFLSYWVLTLELLSLEQSVWMLTCFICYMGPDGVNW